MVVGIVDHSTGAVSYLRKGLINKKNANRRCTYFI